MRQIPAYGSRPLIQGIDSDHSTSEFARASRPQGPGKVVGVASTVAMSGRSCGHSTMHEALGKDEMMP